MQLEEQFYELDRVKLRRWLPWLHLFRAFRIAISPKAILLGCVAILLLDYGMAGIAKLPFATAWVNVEHPDRSGWIETESIESLSLTWDKAYVEPLGTVHDAFAHGWLVLQPVKQHVVPAYHLVRPGGGWTGGATAVTGLLWCLLVWSICGVGIARLAAVRFAADQSPGLRGSVRYALRKVSPSLAAAIVPMVGVALLWFAGVVLGLMGHIPAVGGALVGIGWGLALLGGLAMALILLGLAAGWPLMLCSVAVEDADGFDAFSRIYNYLFGRPWYALFLMLLTLLYGSALIVFACTLLTATHTLTAWAVGSGLGHDGLIALTSPQPPDLPFPTLAFQTWQGVAGLVLHGFLVSYFWTASTIVYFLLRKSADAVPLDTVTILPRDAGDTGLPLVGMPAAEKRESEAAVNEDASGEALA